MGGEFGPPHTDLSLTRVMTWLLPAKEESQPSVNSLQGARCHFHLLLFLSPASIQKEGISLGCECQEVGVIGANLGGWIHPGEGHKSMAVAVGNIKLKTEVGGGWVVKGSERRVHSVNFLLQTVRGPEVYKAGLPHNILI